MGSEQLWALTLRADSSSAEARQRLAGEAEARIGGRSDWILLSTCHRLEFYGFGTAPDLDLPLRFEAGEPAVEHLFRVAAGLDSAVIGEDEVLHQVRQALQHARASRPLDGRLIRLFETAIATGRRSRAGRTASSGSLAQRAVAWLQQKAPLAGGSVIVAGAGRMGSALAHASARAGATVTIASRDVRRARRLARVYGGRGLDLDEAAALVPASAGVVIALAGVWHQLRPAGNGLPPIADISAPSAVPAAVRTRLNGNFLGIDDLYVHSEPPPRGYIEEAERVVAAKTAEYVRWLAGVR